MQNQPNVAGMGKMDSMMSGASWQRIFARIKLVLTDPKGCWSTIQSEPGDMKSIYMGYIIPVAGFYYLAQFIGAVVWGYSFMGVTYRPSMTSSLTQSLMGFILQMVGFAVTAQILSFLAPKFEGRASPEAALKLLAYSATATFVAGVFFLIPIPLSSIVMLVLGIYSAYIMWSGIEPMMAVSAAKKIPYAIVSIIASAIVMLVIGLISAGITGGAGMNPYMDGTTTGTIKLPGGVTFDPNEAQKSMEQLQRMMPQTPQ